MNRAKCLPGIVLLCLFSLACAGPLAGQDKQPNGSKQKEKDAPSQSVQFKGEARTSIHPYKMDQGALYRITVKTESFFPEVFIDGKGTTTIFNYGSPDLAASPPPVPLSSREKTAQMTFTPPATKEYQIRVGHLPGQDVAQGPLPYTVTIERAAFKPVVAVKDNKLEINEQSRRMEQGKMYNIIVTGKGFAPEAVQIMDGTRIVGWSNTGRWFGFGPDAEYVTSFTFKPERTIDYRVAVFVGPTTLNRQIPLAYSLLVAELKVELALVEKLTVQEPFYPRRGGPHKIHTVNLQAGKKYQIDMISQAFNTYLFLEDAVGGVITEDDDGGEGLNARIIFQPARSGTYRIVATTSDQSGKSAGPYTLSVIENPNAQPRLVSPVPVGKSEKK